MINVDGIFYEWDGQPLTIYQFLSQKGIVIPCFCYHEKLNIAGNCRMCLVEANNALVVSCALPLAPQMTIITSSERLSHCRENVLEFLLANHPLDCPICDQGGECDLQDISKTFGLDRGRFYEAKRSVDNLNCFGSFVKTLMTRCIHCTRCVRFLSEYCDQWALGVIGRGSSMEIGSFTQSAFAEDPLSANIIDLCPVGALTSMPYAFKARPWEIKSIESIDILDSLASGLRFDVAHNRLVRCLPLLTANLNEDWITNKARFAYYSLQRQECVTPLLKLNNEWVSISWRQATALFISAFVKTNRPFAVRTGNFVDLESASLLKFFCQNFKKEAPYSESISQAAASSPELYLFNSTLEELEASSLVLLIGSNLRWENPLVYLRLRRNYLRRRTTTNPLKVYAIGLAMDYDNLPITHLGCSVSSVERLLQGRLNGMKDFFFSGFLGLHLFNIFKPVHRHPKVIIGPALLELPQAAELQRRLWNFCHLWERLLGPNTTPIYNVALDYLGKLSMFAVDCVTRSQDSMENRSPSVIWNLMTETSGRRSPDDFIVYQGFSLPSSLASSVNLFFPTASPLEKSSHYLNLLGLVRTSRLVLSPLKTTYTDPQIIRFFHRFALRYLSLPSSSGPTFYLTALRLSLARGNFPWKGDFVEGFQRHHGIFLEHNWSFLASRRITPKTAFLSTVAQNPLKEALPDSLLSGSLENYYTKDVFSRMSPLLVSCSMKCVSSNFALRIAS